MAKVQASAYAWRKLPSENRASKMQPHGDDWAKSVSRQKRIGDQGEAHARRYLLRQGYAIREANWFSLYGELDIIAEQAGVLVFIEVKARRSRDTESALAGISHAKQERMLKAIYHYLDAKGLDWDAPWRIDVIAVALDGNGGARIAHVEDAFDW